jgi:CheY-like chemotaxis protein
MPKALVVEDDLRVLALVRQGLQTEGFTVLEAQDSKEAWRILREERPEAAVVDLYLRTERDGWNFLETVRGDGRFARFPMVVMTGSVGPEAGERARALGCGFLTKPFEPAELMEVLREEMKRALTAMRVLLHLPGLRIEGTVHLQGARFSDGWEVLMDQDRAFISVADATVSPEGGRESTARFVQVRKAEILAVSPQQED